MTDRPLNVRTAGPYDHNNLLALMKLAWEEQPISGLNEEKLQNMIRICTGGRRDGEPQGFIGVIDGKNGLEGYFLAVLSTWWFGDGWRIEELSNFVHPDHRKSNHAKDLIQFGKWMAESIELPLIMGITTGIRLQAKIRLYERHVTPFGALFYHNMNQGCLAEAQKC